MTDQLKLHQATAAIKLSWKNCNSDSQIPYLFCFFFLFSSNTKLIGRFHMDNWLGLRTFSGSIANTNEECG